MLYQTIGTTVQFKLDIFKIEPSSNPIAPLFITPLDV